MPTGAQPLFRAKELWMLVHDDSLITSEREKASKNRKKFGGRDQSSALFQSIPNRSGVSQPTGSSFTTETRSNGAGSETSHTDPVAATEQRLAQLGVEEEEPPSELSASGGGRAPPAKNTKAKPKLSQISVSFRQHEDMILGLKTALGDSSKHRLPPVLCSLQLRRSDLPSPATHCFQLSTMCIMHAICTPSCAHGCIIISPLCSAHRIKAMLACKDMQRLGTQPMYVSSM
jgi:hypothetical protein